MKNNITIAVLVIGIIILLLMQTCGGNALPKPEIITVTDTVVKTDTVTMQDTLIVTRVEKDTITIISKPEITVVGGDTAKVHGMIREDNVSIEYWGLIIDNQIDDLTFIIENERTCTDSIITNTITIRDSIKTTINNYIPANPKTRLMLGGGAGANIINNTFSVNVKAGFKDKKDRVYYLQYEPIVQGLTLNVIVPINFKKQTNKRVF
jgi:hypothetical protein